MIDLLKLTPNDLRGAYLRKQRRLRGATQAAVAYGTGLDSHAVSDLELGTRAPTEEEAAALGDWYGFDPELLLGDATRLIEGHDAPQVTGISETLTVEVRQVIAACLTECAQRLAGQTETHEKTESEEPMLFDTYTRIMKAGQIGVCRGMGSQL